MWSCGDPACPPPWSGHASSKVAVMESAYIANRPGKLRNPKASKNLSYCSASLMARSPSSATRDAPSLAHYNDGIGSHDQPVSTSLANVLSAICLHPARTSLPSSRSRLTVEVDLPAIGYRNLASRSNMNCASSRVLLPSMADWWVVTKPS